MSDRGKTLDEALRVQAGEPDSDPTRELLGKALDIADDLLDAGREDDALALLGDHILPVLEREAKRQA